MSGQLHAQEIIQHEMKIMLQPDVHLIEVEDTITLPEKFFKNDQNKPLFVLHSGLRPFGSSDSVKVIQLKDHDPISQSEIDPKSISTNKNNLMVHYQVSLPAGKRSFTIKYRGKIYDPLQGQMEESDRSFKETSGLITSQGIYLAGSTYWYPRFDNHLVTFSLDVQLPQSWNIMSQGTRFRYDKKEGWTYVGWESKEPQDEIYLIGGKFSEYLGQAGYIKTMVLLRKPDEKLANKYLDTATQYLEMYNKLLGPYPYKKFALVENFWETGYGMPSFTLLGSKVIRFPFILHSSFPHEILHNWWGNGVFVDFNSWNWSEGLTAYLSDHLVKEQRGQGLEYRRSTLQKYTDYVDRNKDFPLTEFRSRHSPVTEAVGYGKSSMFFHMLRRQLGDENFLNGLRELFRGEKFKFGDTGILKKYFSKAYGKNLKNEFSQWIERIGAPELRVSNPSAQKDGKGFRLKATIKQTHSGDAYQLNVPIAVYLKDYEKAFQTTVFMDEKHLDLSLNVPALPLRIDVDPEFDLFRRLDRNEIPPALSQAFGSDKALIVLPNKAPKNIQQSYRKLAGFWKESSKKIDIQLDSDIDILPNDRSVWLLGWENRFRSKIFENLSDYDISIHDAGVIIEGNELKRNNHSFVITARQPDNPEFSLAWIATDKMEAIPGLGRKLPHYGKYSYLAFEGEEPSIVFKGRWPVVNSPMSLLIKHAKRKGVEKEPKSKLASRRALAYLPEIFSKDRMMDVIGFLAGDNMRGRGFGSPELDKAAQFIASGFHDAGLRPLGDNEGSFFQKFKVRGGDPEKEVILKNVVGIIPGNKPDWNGQSVVISAHYDHLGLGWPDVREGNIGKIHPGADDNASGVAILMELAHLLGKNWKPDRTIAFVAFTGEEAGRLGSKYYVKNEKRFPVDKMIGMLNLDTVGRLDQKKMIVLGTGSAREWPHIFMGAGYVTGAKIETVADDFGSSDQKSFLDAGTPAVQLFSGPHFDYHNITDIVDKIDSSGMVKIASVAKEAIEYLAAREKPLTSTLALQKGAAPQQAKNGKDRKVSLGTIPDFAYTGKGIRIVGVMPNSPVERAKLQNGDIITLINNAPIDDLRSFSKVLKTFKPGHVIVITFIREGQEKTVKVKAAKR